MLATTTLTNVFQMSLGINKGRHKFKQSDTHKSPTPLNLLGSQSNEYLYDRKSVEFEKAIDSLRFSRLLFALRLLLIHNKIIEM
jgi:hypothetical protein